MISGGGIFVLCSEQILSGKKVGDLCGHIPFSAHALQAGFQKMKIRNIIFAYHNLQIHKMISFALYKSFSFCKSFLSCKLFPL